MMLLAKPSNVKMEKAIDHLPEWPDDVETLSDYSKIMKFCVEGFPSFAKPESAKRQYKRVLSSIINDLTIHYEI